jgi:hypothetical protein
MWVSCFNKSTLPADNKGIYRYRLISGTWTKVAQSSTLTTVTNASRIELATAPKDNNVLYALYDNFNIVKTINATSATGSSTWTNLTNPTTSVPSVVSNQTSSHLSIAVDPLNINIVVVGSLRIAKTINGDTTWTSLFNSGTSPCNIINPHVGITNLVFKPNLNNSTATATSSLYACTDGGIYNCTNANSSACPYTWLPLNNNLNITQFYSCAMNNTTDYNFFSWCAR